MSFEAEGASLAQHLIEMWPAWLAMAVSGIIALNRAVEESSKFAGVLGGWGKKMHDRAIARKQVEFAAAELAEAVMKAVEDARRAWQSDENAALRAMDERLEAVAEVTTAQKKDLEEMRFQVRCQMAYSEYEIMWHHKLLVKVSQSPNGCLDYNDIPHHIDYWQFESMYRANDHWREWIDKQP